MKLDYRGGSRGGRPLSKIPGSAPGLQCIRWRSTYYGNHVDAVQWAPDGDRRRRGRPSETWRQTFQEDLQQEMRVSWSGVRGVATDRSRLEKIGLVVQYSNWNGRIWVHVQSLLTYPRPSVRAYLGPVDIGALFAEPIRVARISGEPGLRKVRRPEYANDDR